MLLYRLRDEGKIIIITNMNSNILYEVTDEVIIFDDYNVLVAGNTNDIYTKNIKLLLDSNIEVPYFSLLTYLASTRKNIELFYRTDVRDVIKDVYKSIS